MLKNPPTGNSVRLGVSSRQRQDSVRRGQGPKRQQTSTRVDVKKLNYKTHDFERYSWPKKHERNKNISYFSTSLSYAA